MEKVINDIFTNDFAEAASVLSVVSEEGEGSEGANRLSLCMQMTVSWYGWLPDQWPQPPPRRSSAQAITLSGMKSKHTLFDLCK